MGPPQAQKTLVLRPRTRQNVSRDHPIHTAQLFRESAPNLTIQIASGTNKERANRKEPSSKTDESPPVNFRFGVCDLDTFHKVQRHYPRYGHIIPSAAPVDPSSANAKTGFTAGAAKEKVVIEPIGKTKTYYFGRGFVVENQDPRPTHPSGGYRIGEASNPGPGVKSGQPKPTQKQQHRINTHKDRRPTKKARPKVCDHKFCHVAHCQIYGHYHEKKRRPAVGAKLREIQKLQSKNRAEGTEAERAEPVFLLCRNPFGCDCGEDHFHDLAQLVCGQCVQDEEEKADESEDLAEELDEEDLASEPEEVVDAQAPGNESELTHREPAITAARGFNPQLNLPVAHPVGGEDDQLEAAWNEFQNNWDEEHLVVPPEQPLEVPPEQDPVVPPVRRFGGGEEWVDAVFNVDADLDAEIVRARLPHHDPALFDVDAEDPPAPVELAPPVHQPGDLPIGHEVVYIYSRLPGERDAFDDSLLNRFLELFLETDIETKRNHLHLERYKEVHEQGNIGKKTFANAWYYKWLQQKEPRWKPRLSKRVHTDMVRTLGFNSFSPEVIYTPLYEYLWRNGELRNRQYVDDSNQVRAYYKGNLRIVAQTHESFATLSPKVWDATLDYLFFQFVIRDYIGNARKGKLDVTTAPGKEKPSVQKVILNGGGPRG